MHFHDKVGFMKTVFFIRHAKSSWDDPSLRDIDRPLNPRGLRDAPFMAKLVRAKTPELDKIISSPANRAFTTATFFAKEFGIAEEDIEVKKAIYEAFTADVTTIIQNLPSDINSVLIFGHNPTFTSLANLFSKDYIPNVPTCGVSKVTANIADWKQFNEQTGQLVDYMIPKMYL